MFVFVCLITTQQTMRSFLCVNICDHLLYHGQLQLFMVIKLFLKNCGQLRYLMIIDFFWENIFYGKYVKKRLYNFF